MSLLDINTTGRNRNVLSPVVEPTIVTAPTSPVTPPFDPTTSSFTLRVTNFNLLSPQIGAAGQNSVLFTGTDGAAFSTPAGKNVIVKNLYLRLTGLALSGTYLGYNWTAPTLRGYRNGTDTLVTNSFNFTSGTAGNPLSSYAITDHFGFSSTPAAGRRTLLAGESLTLGVSVAYSAGTSGFTFTTLSGDAYAECLLVNV